MDRIRKEYIKIKPLDKSDMEMLINFQQKNYPNNPLINEDNFKWQISDNFIIPQIAWVAIDSRNNQIIGFFQILVQEFFINGHLYKVGYCCNVLISKKYQQLIWRNKKTKNFHSIFTKLYEVAYKNAKKDGLFFLWAIPNTNSYTGFKDLLKFTEIDSLDLKLLPLKSDTLIKKFFLNSIIVKFFILIINTFVSLYIKIFFSKNNKNKVFRKINSSDLNKIQEFISTSKNQSNIYQNRSKDYLIWRYFNSPRDYSIYGVFNLKDKLDAWCVTTKLNKGDDSYGYYNVEIIVDLFIDSSKEGIKNGKQLLSNIITLFKKDKDRSLVIVLSNKNDKYAKVFSKFFLMPQKYTPRKFPLLIKSIDKNSHKVIQNNYLWSIFFGDYDIV